MTWDYDVALLEQKDQVRFLIGDTDASNPLVQNEEIEWALSEQGNVYAAAALVAQTLGGRFATTADKSVGDLKLKFSEQSRNFFELAKNLKMQVLSLSQVQSAGADVIATKEANEADTTLVEPKFTKDMHEHADGLVETFEE